MSLRAFQPIWHSVSKSVSQKSVGSQVCLLLPVLCFLPSKVLIVYDTKERIITSALPFIRRKVDCIIITTSSATVKFKPILGYQLKSCLKELKSITTATNIGTHAHKKHLIRQSDRQTVKSLGCKNFTEVHKIVWSYWMKQCSLR